MSFGFIKVFKYLVIIFISPFLKLWVIFIRWFWKDGLPISVQAVSPEREMDDLYIHTQVASQKGERRLARISNRINR